MRPAGHRSNGASAFSEGQQSTQYTKRHHYIVLLYVAYFSMAGVQATLLPALVNPAYGAQPVNTDVLQKCISSTGSQVIDPDGSSYLKFAPSFKTDGDFVITSSGGPACQPVPLPELSTAAALQLEFKTPVQGDCTSTARVTMRCFSSPTVMIADYIDTGIISTTDWRVVTIPVSVLLNNTGLQGCNLPPNATWDLSRQKSNMAVTVCSKCPDKNAKQQVCHVRNLQFVGSVPTAANKAPIIAITDKNITVPYGGVVKLSAQVTDDGLPGDSADVVTSSVWRLAEVQAQVTWQVAQAPSGYEAGQVVITPHSDSADAAWASFAGAPSGTYVLTITASDGQLSRSENLTVNHLGWPNAVAIVSPRDNPLPGEPSYFFLDGTGNTLTVKAILSIASTMTAADFKVVDIDCSGPGPCTKTVPTAVQTVSNNGSTMISASATFAFTTPGTYSISARAVVDTSGVQEPGFPAVIQGKNRVVLATTDYLVPRTVTWQPGTRIPYAPFHPDMPSSQGDPCSAGPGLMWPPLMQALATVAVAQGGTWSFLQSKDPTGLLSAPDACVLIPADRTVVYDVCNSAAPPYRCIVVLGKLYFSKKVSTCLRVGTIQALDGGLVYVDHKRAGQVTTNITFSTADALNPLEDPALITVGLLAFHANVYMRGTARCGHMLKAANGSMVAGATTIQVPGSGSCWQPGDIIAFPETQPRSIAPYMFNEGYTKPIGEKQTELKVVVSVSPDGTVVLNEPLTYSHKSEAPLSMLTRSVTLRTDITNSKARAHVVASGQTTLQLRNVAIYDTGRTTIQQPAGDTTFDSMTGAVIQQHYNPRGRYGCHSHRNRRPVIFQGMAVASTLPSTVPLPRHGLVCHDSHCTVANNTVVGHSGSGIFAEDGSETGVISGNLVMCSGFGSGLADQFAASTGGKDLGHGGHGLWARSTLISMTDNIVVGMCPQSAYTYFTKCSAPQSSSVPRVEGINDGLRGAPLKTCQYGIGAYSVFNNNSAIGVFLFGLHHMYINSTSTLGDFTVITYATGQPTAFASTFSSRINLNNPRLITTVPNSGIAIAPINAGMGNNEVGRVRWDSLVVSGGTIEGFQRGVMVFPNGTLVDAASIQATGMDILFGNTTAFVTLDNGASQLVELRGYGSQPFVLRPKTSTATLASASATLPANMTTDGFVVMGGLSGLF